MNNINVNTHLASDEELIINTVKKRKEVLPAYSCIGGNMDYTTRIEGYPELFTVLRDLSKKGTWLFWTLIMNRNSNNNIAIFKAETVAEAATVARAYKELYALNLVIRLKRQHYLVNPYVMFPMMNHMSPTVLQWREATNEELN